MALWLVRSGKYGEHESRFFQDSRIYLTWDEFSDTDLAVAQDYEGIKSLMQQKYPGEPARRIGNWSGQVWAFVLAMKPGDWVVVPRKSNGTIAVGEIQSEYAFAKDLDPTYRHYRSVKWLNTDVPRSAFDKDLLFSLGAIMTVCEIKRNDAEKRIRAMAKKDWTSQAVAASSSALSQPDLTESAEDADVDIEEEYVDIEEHDDDDHDN